jgi:mono/diheme cytochrome c family protein
MPLFLLKSILSLGIVLLTVVSMFTMFEYLGREEKRFNPDVLRRIHKVNGVLYVLLFLYIAYLCLGYLRSTKVELGARPAFHSVFALTVVFLLCLKVLFVRVYRKFYGQVRMLGLLIALVTLAMVGLSGGYYLLIGKPAPPRPEMAAGEIPPPEEAVFVLRIDPESIGRGRELYEEKCSFCHYPDSHEALTGPGHKGILKNPHLPASGRSATPENILRQLRDPLERMPSFAYLSDDEAADIIAFLNTL